MCVCVCVCVCVCDTFKVMVYESHNLKQKKFNDKNVNYQVFDFAHTQYQLLSYSLNST